MNDERDFQAIEKEQTEKGYKHSRAVTIFPADAY